MRRLNRWEYENTIRDLLGDDTRPGKDFPEDEQGFGFDTNAGALSVTPARAEAYLVAAELIATRAVGKLATLHPCSAKPDAACADSFVGTFARRAWRRPPAPAELDRLARLFADGQKSGGFAGGASLVLRALLVSAPFLHLVEIGMPAGGTARLGSWEMASRLSYALWGTMPDAALFALAEQDRLKTPEDVRAAATRMLADPKARLSTGRFATQWLQTGELATLEKAKAAFPRYDDALRTGLRQELDRFVEDVSWATTGGGLMSGLHTASHSFQNAKVAALYGATGATGATLERVALDPTRRAGLLTRAGLMAVLAHPNQTAPTLRGEFVLEQLLCSPPPPPPPGVNNAVPEPDPRSTARERLSQHGSDPACGACHRLMDPIGFALEGYDGIGAWRTTDGGRPLDLSGEAPGTDLGGPFQGGVELGKRLAGSPTARRCLAVQWFRYLLGRQEQAADQPVIERLTTALAAGGNAPTVLATLVESEPFRTRVVAPEGGRP
jgi:hypothetical protein